jgi:hypothetical protein
VFGFKLMVFQVVYKYMSGSISVAAETGVVAIGPIANLCVFLSFVALGSMFHKVRAVCCPLLRIVHVDSAAGSTVLSLFSVTEKFVRVVSRY